MKELTKFDDQETETTSHERIVYYISSCSDQSLKFASKTTVKCCNWNVLRTLQRPNTASVAYYQPNKMYCIIATKTHNKDRSKRLLDQFTQNTLN